LAQAIIKIIVTPHLILKVFLFICVVGLSGYSSYLVILSTMNYFTYSVSTTTRTFDEVPSLFPKVTFCNLNMFQTQYAFNNFYSLYFNSRPISENEEKMLGHDLNDILIICLFNNIKYNSGDFIWSWDELYGNCFTFNSGFDSNGNRIDLKTVTLEGPMSGLKLTIYVNVYEKLIIANGVFLEFGVVMRIGNSSYSTFHPYSDGVSVSPGFQTKIVIDREFKSMLPKPYSNCEIVPNTPKYLEGMDLYNLISESNYEYTQQLCFRQCYQKYIIQKYNCSCVWFPSLFNVTQCTLSFSRIIWYTYGDNFNPTFINKYCFHSCPLKCDQILYKTSLSFSFFNSLTYISSIQSNSNLSKDFINRTIDATTAKESIVNVNIFYDSLSYTLNTESPQMDAVSLLGSIGGNLGLFLVVSFFSISEIIEVILEIFFILKHKKQTIQIES